MSTPVIRFRIDFSATCAVAPAKIDLLEAIRNSGSLSRGARNLGMSYRRARMLIDSFKGAFREPVTRAIRGGPGGGGVVRTKFGAELVDRYRDLEREFGTLATRRLQMFTSSVASQRRPKSPSVSRTCHGRISREVSPINARQVRGLVWGTIHFNRTACGTLGTVHTTPPLPQNQALKYHRLALRQLYAFCVGGQPWSLAPIPSQRRSNRLLVSAHSTSTRLHPAASIRCAATWVASSSNALRRRRSAPLPSQQRRSSITSVC